MTMALRRSARRAGLVSAGTLALVFSGAGMAFATTTAPVPLPSPSAVDSVVGTVTSLVTPTPTPTPTVPGAISSPVAGVTSALSGVLPGSAPSTLPSSNPTTGAGNGGSVSNPLGRHTNSGPGAKVVQAPGSKASRLDAAGSLPNQSVYGYLTGVTMPNLGNFDAAALPSAGMAPQVAPAQAPDVASNQSRTALGLVGSHSPSSVPAVLIVLAVATVGAAAAAHVGVMQQRLASAGGHAAG